MIIIMIETSKSRFTRFDDREKEANEIFGRKTGTIDSFHKVEFCLTSVGQSMFYLHWSRLIVA